MRKNITFHLLSGAAKFVPVGTVFASILDLSGKEIGDIEKMDGFYYIHRGKNRANLGREFTLTQAIWLSEWMASWTGVTMETWELALREMKGRNVK